MPLIEPPAAPSPPLSALLTLFLPLLGAVAVAAFDGDCRDLDNGTEGMP